jgi:hypothetical protein
VLAVEDFNGSIGGFGNLFDGLLDPELMFYSDKA